MVEDTRDSQVDRGWACLIVIGYFTSVFCMVGIGKSFGILMEEFVEHFDTSVAVTSLIMAVYGGVYTVFAPLCVSAGMHFGQRKIVMVGGVIGAAGLCLSSLLLSIEWVIVVIGVLFGIGNSSIFGNGLVMINQYFDKRRSLANGLALSGASIGQFAIPPLLQFLLDRYSLQGALLVVGAIYLHVSVCGALYRPISSYKKKSTKDILLKEENKAISKESVMINQTIEHEILGVNPEEKGKGSPPANSNTSINNTSTRGESDEGEALHVCHGDENNFKMNYGKHPEENSSENKESLLNVNVEFIAKGIQSISYSQKVCEGDDEERVINRDLIDNRTRNYGAVKTFVFGLMDFSALKGSVALLFVSVSFLFFFGHFNFILYMPQTAFRRGVSKYEKAYLVSINGLCDLFGRLSVGGLGDLGVIQRYKLFAATTFFCGASILGFAFARSFVMMGVCAGLYGFFGGGYVAINAPTLIDLVGQQRMPKVLGAVLFIQGIGAAIGQPILGALRDVTGSYNVVHNINGLAMMAGSALLVFYPVVKRYDRTV